MEPSPSESLSSGESTESRSNRLISPVPQHLNNRSPYDHHQCPTHAQNHLHMSPVTQQHPLTPRYVTTMEGSYGSPERIYPHSTPLHPPPIKYEPTPLIQNFHHRETPGSSPVLKSLCNFGDTNQRVNIGKSSLSLTQIECICEAMLQRKDINRLDEFLKPISQRLHIGSESIYRARIHVLFHCQNYNEMYKLMEAFDYSPKYHAELQDLWYQAHYKEQENVRGRNLGAVDKYRIRNKFILPKTIWDGERTTYCFKDRAREALKECFERCRYPTPIEKKALSEITGLTSIQVSNWFKNKRQRERTPQPREGMEMDPSSGGSGTLGQGCGLPSNFGHGKGGDDSSNDMKPLAVTFRSHKKIKINKTFGCGGGVGGGGLGLLDYPIPLMRKDPSIYPSLPNVTITPKNHNHLFTTTPPQLHHHHLQEADSADFGRNREDIQSSGGSSSTSVSNNPPIIQPHNPSHSHLYVSHSQPTPYETLLHQQYPNTQHHSNSPHILSYG